MKFGVWTRNKRESATAVSTSSDRSAVSLSSSVASNGGSKPLPLKQRTSSVSDRRDFSHSTWISLLRLIKIREYFISTDNFSIWRRHLAWAFEDGKDLRQYMTQRYASTMVFMSLLLSTELGVLFNSAKVTTEVRFNLHNSNHETVSFWAGLLIIISALLTILSLISTFTAWAMVSAIDGKNAHCILRSSIGQYAAELPGRLVVFSIYSFLTSFMLFFFLLLPIGFWSILLLVSTAVLFVHVISVFSCFGRIIMHTGAMGTSRIFSSEYEGFLEPHSLHTNLRNKAECNLAHSTSIMRQYRMRQQPIDRYLANDKEMHDHLSGLNTHRQHLNNTENNNSSIPINRPRTDSVVRFADEEQGMGYVPTGNRNQSTNEGDSANVFRPKIITADKGVVDKTYKYGSITGDDNQLRSNLTPLSEGSQSRSDRSCSLSDTGMEELQAGFTATTPHDAGNGMAGPPSTIFTETVKSNDKTKSSGLPPYVPAPINNKPAAVSQSVGRHRSNISSISNISNVSNASIEQWLQGSSVGSPRPTKKAEIDINDGSVDIQTDRNDSGYPLPTSLVGDPTAAVTTPIATTALRMRDGTVRDALMTSSTGGSSIQNSHRTELSESEQFDYDYGPENTNLDVTPFENSGDYGTGVYSAYDKRDLGGQVISSLNQKNSSTNSNDPPQRSDDNLAGALVEDERSSLLKKKNNTEDQNL